MATSGTRDVIDELEHLLWERRAVATAGKLRMSSPAALSDALFPEYLRLLTCISSHRIPRYSGVAQLKSSSEVQFIDVHASQPARIFSGLGKLPN